MTLILFLIFIGLLIFFHEIGHFWGARKVGLKVEEFSIGFPPFIFNKKSKDTTYRLGLILFGGYVKLKGENDPNDPEGFLNLKHYKKLVVILSGVFFNIILAYFLISFSLYFGYPVESNKIVVSGFFDKTTQGYKFFKVGDEILGIKIGDQFYKPKNVKEFHSILSSNKGEKIEIIYLREGKVLSTFVVPPVGFYISGFSIEKYNFPLNFIFGFKKTFEIIKNVFLGFLEFAYNLFKDFKSVNLEVVGPVGIYGLFDNFKNFGIGYIFYFVAFLSINLAFINSLPLPALDGGRALLVLIEMFLGKKIDYNKEEEIHKIGFIILFVLLLLITFKDIYKLWLK